MLIKLFTWGFWLWTLVVAVVGGFVGASLNCEGGEGCRPGFPSWFQPWTWGDYSVFPETLYTALPALVSASAFVALAISRRALAATVAVLVTLALLSYAYFGGFTAEGRAILTVGPLLGLGALGALRRAKGRS